MISNNMMLWAGTIIYDVIVDALKTKELKKRRLCTLKQIEAK